MAEHQVVNDSEINAAMQAASAIIEQRRPDTNLSQRTLLLRRELGERLRREFGKQLPAVFAGTGLDSEKLNKILAEHQSEVRSVLAEEKSKTAKSFAALGENLRRGIENQKRALEQIANISIVSATIPLWTAWKIDGPQSTPFASHIEAANNWAVLAFERGIDGRGSVDVGFWFSWQNPSQRIAVLKIDTDLIVQGLCEAHADPPASPWFHRTTYVDLSAQLNIYVGGAILQSEVASIGGAKATADWGNVIDAEVISSTEHLSRGPIEVDAGAGALFMIHFWADYTVDDLGRVILDFESSGGIIKCPVVQLEVLSPLIAP
jgi:hypothetical protein